jgi:uncharacterized Zn-binding protein involved in type VI secretion
MPNATRLGDATVDGIVVQGSPNVFINRLPAGRGNDVTACTHGVGWVVCGSKNIRINREGAVRIGDPATCPVIMLGPMMSGSPNVIVGR